MTEAPTEEFPELDALQTAANKAALKTGIAAIRAEEALVCVNHTIAEVDRWEAGAFPGGRRARQDQGRQNRL